MRKIICTVVLLVSFSTFGQTTLIPDPNFEQALIDLGYDNVLDGQVLTNNISSIVNLNISFKNINDLTGIEAFQSLSNLNCDGNNLVSLNLNSNVNLRWLDCVNNNINYLNVDSCVLLMHMDCSFNELNSLNVNHNEELQELYCPHNLLIDINLGPLNNTPNIPDLSDLNVNDNQLTYLDITDFPNLESFSCLGNNLTCLKVNVWLGWSQWNSFQTTSNPNLFCIETDNVSWSQIYWGDDIDPWTQFNSNCDIYCNPSSGINEEEVVINKKVVNYLNLLGQEIEPKSNMIYLKLYNDGSIEKEFRME